MHLTYEDLTLTMNGVVQPNTFDRDTDLDSHIFYSVPNSFFSIDERIPRVIRELVTEAEGCIKMNFLTGASASARKAIYELLSMEGAVGKNYDEKIKDFGDKNSTVDPEAIEILKHIKDMTSDHVHEENLITWTPLVSR
jgi:hypothetical protein